MKATDFIVDVISKKAKVVFGYQGGNIAHMIDSIWRHPDVEFVSSYNEQGAAFSACGYALESQSLGVALASSGPGAINLISGIANAYYDSIPCLFITGNVSIPTMKTTENIRQSAFQENDIVAMVSKVTKYAITITDAHDLRYHLEKAIYLAKEGRPGPVLIDLPHNIQKIDLEYWNEKAFSIQDNDICSFSNEAQKVALALKNANRPLVIVGGGASSKKASKLINQLVNKWELPTVATLRGIDILSHENRYYVGFGGAYGNRAANLAIKYADVILVLGARLDERFISLSDKSMFDKKTVFHVDIDTNELGRVIPHENKINANVEDFLDDLLDIPKPAFDFSAWICIIKKWIERYPSVIEEWSVNKAISVISRCSPNVADYTLDIGINQMSAAQTIFLNGLQHCFTSAGHGAMGCSIPLAIGVAYANNNHIVNCIVGDGALHMNIQELLMVGKNKLPIHIILNNNNCLGMIRDYQVKAFDSRFAGTVDFLSGINYKMLAATYGIQYFLATNEAELKETIEALNSKEPCFVELQFPCDTNTNPLLGLDMFSQLPLLVTDTELAKEALQCGNTISW